MTSQHNGLSLSKILSFIYKPKPKLVLIGIRDKCCKDDNMETLYDFDKDMLRCKTCCRIFERRIVR